MISLRLESYSLISNKMNFKKILLASAIFGALFVTSCKENEGPITPVDITVSSDYLEIPEEGSTTSVTVKSNTAWEAEIVISNPWGDEEANFEKNPWISVSPLAGGAGEEVAVNIEVAQNTSDSVLYQREVVIYFRTEQMIYATTTVHQLGGELKPNADTGPKPISVADFLAAEESNQWYRLSGKITNLSNTTYGNFDLVDATGTIYVYGLNLNATAGDKTFSQIGLQEGDNVTLVGRRASYQGDPQVGDAYYAPLKVTIAEFLAAEVDDNQLYELTGTMDDLYNTEYGNFHLIDEEGGDVTVYGLTSTPIIGMDNDKSFSKTGYANGDVLTIVGTRDDYRGTPQVGGPAYAVRIKTDVDPNKPVRISIADFLNAEVSGQLYQLSGKITEIEQAEYGNFTLVDAEGNSVYVYGLNASEEAGSKTFAQTGLREGDNVTLIGRRSDFKGTPQVGDAYYAAKKVTLDEFLAAEVGDQLYELTAVIYDLYNTQYGNFHLIDDAGNDVTVYGMTATPLIGSSNDKSFSTLGYVEGDVVTLVGTRDEHEGDPQVGGPSYAVRAKAE